MRNGCHIRDFVSSLNRMIVFLLASFKGKTQMNWAKNKEDFIPFIIARIFVLYVAILCTNGKIFRINLPLEKISSYPADSLQKKGDCAIIAKQNISCAGPVYC